MKLEIRNGDEIKLCMLLHNSSLNLHRRWQKKFPYCKLFHPKKIASLFLSREHFTNYLLSDFFSVIILEVSLFRHIRSENVNKGIFTSPPNILER